MILADDGAEGHPGRTTHEGSVLGPPRLCSLEPRKKSIDLDLRSTGVATRPGISSGPPMFSSRASDQERRKPSAWDTGWCLRPTPLVYCSLSAFGRHGPYSQLKAYDGVVNAKAGRMHDQVGHYRNRPIYRAVNDTSYHAAMFGCRESWPLCGWPGSQDAVQLVETSLLRGTTAPNNPWRRFDGADSPADRYPGQDNADDALQVSSYPIATKPIR